MPYTPAGNIVALNGGLSAADAILNGLGVEVVFAASTLDVASVASAAIDQASGAVVTNLRASLSPAHTTATNGSGGSYDDATKQFTVASTAGLAAGDYLELQHANINGGAVQPLKIASVASGTALTFAQNPFNGLGNKTGILYQVAWRLAIAAGSGGSVSSAGGTANYTKFGAADASGNAGLSENVFYVRDAPAGSAFLSLNGGDAVAGAVGNTPTPALAVLAAWASRGGVSHLAWANHSAQARNDFRWGDGTTGEKTIAAALAGSLQLTAGDGVKYGRLVMRAAPGSAVTVERDVSYTLDSTAPVIVMHLAGR